MTKFLKAIICSSWMEDANITDTVLISQEHGPLMGNWKVPSGPCMTLCMLSIKSSWGIAEEEEH
jgi:hypothetical protein